MRTHKILPLLLSKANITEIHPPWSWAVWCESFHHPAPPLLCTTGFLLQCGPFSSFSCGVCSARLWIIFLCYLYWCECFASVGGGKFRVLLLRHLPNWPISAGISELRYCTLFPPCFPWSSNGKFSSTCLKVVIYSRLFLLILLNTNHFCLPPASPNWCNYHLNLPSKTIKLLGSFGLPNCIKLVLFGVLILDYWYTSFCVPLAQAVADYRLWQSILFAHFYFL